MRKMFQAQKALRLGTTNNTTKATKDGNEEPKKKITQPFQWIGSDGWADRYFTLNLIRIHKNYKNSKFKIRKNSLTSLSSSHSLDVVDGVESEAAGSFSIRIHSPRVDGFEPYYFSLNPENHTKNPWFREFWQQKFKCLLTVPKDDTHSTLCDVERQNLTNGYEQDPKLSQVSFQIHLVKPVSKDGLKLTIGF